MSITTATIKTRRARSPKASAQNKNLTNNSKPKSRNKKKSKAKSPTANPVIPRLVLSPCALAYARAKLMPFEYQGNELPCLPDTIDIPSYKFATFNRGVCAIGGNGWGYVALDCNVRANDYTSIVYTGTTFVGVTIDLSSATVGVSAISDTKYPWASTAPRQTRVVASALRVRYTGTELNRGGQIFTLANNSFTNVVGYTASQLATIPSVKSYPVTRGWVTVGFNSTDYQDYQYYPNAGAALNNSSGDVTSLIALVGTAGNTFEWEIIRYLEATTGTTSGAVNTVPSETKSHSDPVGFGVVKDFFGSSYAAEIGNSAYNAFIKFASAGAAAQASSYFSSASRRPTIEW